MFIERNVGYVLVSSCYLSPTRLAHELHVRLVASNNIMESN